MVTDNPVDVVLGHVGQGDVIALQERKPGVVVLKVQIFPHALRHLIDKAENAFVVTVTVFAHQTVFKFDAQILIKILFDFQTALLSVLCLHVHLYIGILYQKFKIKNILNDRAVHCHNFVAGLQSHLFRDAARFDVLDYMTFVFVHKTDFSFRSRQDIPAVLSPYTLP